MFRVNVLTGFQVDFTTFVAAWAETDRFFSQNTGKTCVRLSVPNYLFSMLKSCFTDCFIWERQSGDRAARTALSTGYNTIKSKNIAFFEGKARFFHFHSSTKIF